jgi:AraC family transcriptional regulator of arabinose operon
VRHLRAHLNEPPSLPKLAALSHLSVSRFAHLFREQVGLSPLAFLERERLNRAAQLLTLTSRPVARVALEVGYEDALYFSRRFRARYGVGPRQYRQDSLQR